MSRANLGLVGNGHTAALIDNNLTVQWFCPGRFDNFPLLAGALDPVNGGNLRLTLKLGNEPLAPQTQSYLPQTNLLCTKLHNRYGYCKVTDFMPWGQPLLVRAIELTNNESRSLTGEIVIQLEPIKTELCSVGIDRNGGVLCAELRLNKEVYPYLTAGQWNEAAVVVGLGIEKTYRVRHLPLSEGPQVSFSIAPGQSLRLAVVLAYATCREKAERALFDSISSALRLADFEARRWRKWLGQARPLETLKQGTELFHAYQRSLLTLKQLIYEPTGAIIAAPTASFPATPGGDENWDYRYMWLRDGYYVALALDKAGFHQEARRFYDFAATLQSPDGNWHNPLYTVTGQHPREYVVPDLHGPTGEVPIRFGNKAAEQLQLDNTGNILDGIWQHYQVTQDLGYLQKWWPQVQSAAKWVMAHWQEPENGIWEFREKRVHWVHGKVMCYAALHAAAELASQLQAEPFRERCQLVAEQIAQDVIANGCSETRKVYLQHYGDDAPLDISVLALAFYGLVPANDLRLAKTVAMMEREINAGGLRIADGFGRYDFARVPFFLPTFWLARYYLLAGNQERALQLIGVCMDNSTPLMLMAEHFDPLTHTQWGNFPQAFSHEELIQVLLQLESADCGL